MSVSGYLDSLLPIPIIFQSFISIPHRADFESLGMFNPIQDGKEESLVLNCISTMKQTFRIGLSGTILFSLVFDEEPSVDADILKSNMQSGFLHLKLSLFNRDFYFIVVFYITCD